MQWHYTLQKKNLGNMLCLGKCSNEIASTSARILGIINSILISFYLHTNISHFNKFLIGQIDKILTIISKYFFYTQIITRKVFVRRFPIYSLP